MPKTEMKTTLPSLSHVSAASEPNTSLAWHSVKEEGQPSMARNFLPVCRQQLFHVHSLRTNLWIIMSLPLMRRLGSPGRWLVDKLMRALFTGVSSIGAAL